MRQSMLAALAAALLWASLALLALPSGQPAPDPASDPAPPCELDPATGAETAAPPASEAEPTAPEQDAFDANCKLAVLTEDGVVVMDLEQYLTGVLLAEMPVSFGEEALKAQAVACRTYTLSRCRNPRHEEAAVCTDSHCCQAWRDPAEVEPAAREQAAAAVRATDGLVLYYQGKLIDATFFSCSGGRTEDAQAVWGSELPYLKAVESPGEEDAAHYSDELRVSLAEFRETIAALDGAAELSGDPAAWVSAAQYTAGGGVAELTLGGRAIRGTALRKAFGLRSTAFSLTLSEDGAVFTTRGNGHRVGMSQYGAAAMARAGNDFEHILKWYYTGVEVCRFR